jgi:hypothetical protein
VNFAEFLFYTVGWISAELVCLGDTLPSFRSYDDFVACERDGSVDMRSEDEGVFVGPADGKDLANPIGGGWSSRSEMGTPQAPTPSTTMPSRPALRNPASTVATRRPSTSWRES